MKKYCVTSLSVGELKKASDLYAGLSYKNIQSFEMNEYVYKNTENSRLDVLYIYSQLLQNESEFGGIFSGNILITNNELYLLDENGNPEIIHENAIIYLLRLGGMSKSFLSFFIRYAKKHWNIDVITSIDISHENWLSTKCYGLAYMDTDNFPQSVIPYICSDTDWEYLIGFLRKSPLFDDQIIIKKDGYSGGDGVKIFSLSDQKTNISIVDFLLDARKNDYIIMKLIETEDTEYRIYWVKKQGMVKILDVHGKERVNGHILHNIAQGNVLRRLDKSVIPETLYGDIVSYCQNMPEHHGGLDILHGKNGKYYFTENNFMTGYLCEPEEQYLAQEWLDSVANCYTS